MKDWNVGKEEAHKALFDRIREDILNFITNRITLLTILFIVLGGVLLYRCFDLQIVQGQEYLDKFMLSTEKTRDISSSRGTIYDCNGVVLAYDDLAYSVKIEDVFESGNGKNKKLNDTVYKLIKGIEKNGDNIIEDFNVILDENYNFVFNVEGSKLLRFLADVYGCKTIDELEEEERNATADEVIEFLGGQKNFAIGDYEVSGDSDTEFIVGKGYTQKELLQMITIRYAMKLTSYRKYIGTTVATDISNETVAVIMENSEQLLGVSIVEDTVRRYTEDSIYFSHILGYTGKISSDELESFNLQDFEAGGTGDRYTLNDMVGKSGIELYMESYLQGLKGYEKVSVDNTGRVISILERTDAIAGNDVYLTLDSELQKAAYNILEQHIAGIVVEKIKNVKEYVPKENDDSSDIIIPIYDVYFAVINNGVIDIREFTDADAGETEKEVYAKYLEYKASVYENLEYEYFEKKTIYDKLTLEYKNYQSDIVTLLKSNGVLVSSLIDQKDKMQIAWATDEVISLHDYLKYCISMNWIDVTRLDLDSQYADSEEIYAAIWEYIQEKIDNNLEFQKRSYRFMIKNDKLSGTEVCKILCEQGKINVPQEDMEALYSGKLKAYNFMMNRIRHLDITPAQLALDPCNGSVVIMDTNTGDVLACVTYPGYDNNRMANTVDAEYWNQLITDKSYPMNNYATTYKGAPGSTFKMVSATAALMEGIVTLKSKINCTGQFKEINPGPWCWKRWGHGNLDVTGAIANSCNYYFYNVGYDLSTRNGVYNAQEGLDALALYATMYGLADKTGIEIGETQPEVSDELPVPSAIGQGSNAFSAVGLTRYVAAVANGGTVYNMTLLDSVRDVDGNIIKEYNADVYGNVVMPQEYWNAIRAGMRKVVEAKTYFRELDITVAGKTGTAEQSSSRPNHALFVGYAPYEGTPEIAVTTRILFGYSSDYAAQTTRDIISYYYGLEEAENLFTGEASDPDAGVSNDEI